MMLRITTKGKLVEVQKLYSLFKGDLSGSLWANSTIIVTGIDYSYPEDCGIDATICSDFQTTTVVPHE